ncbi:MAG: hypothetical protein ACYC6C_12280 [Coriobacteriia bacterium]
MKSLSGSFAVFFLLFSFSIFLVSCSQESGITTPNESKATPMAKMAVLPTAIFDHAKDTVIILPKSGKTLIVKKTAPATQLALLDAYLQTHTISHSPAGAIHPNAGRYYQTVSYWELENQYQPVSGKYIGIWSSKETPQQMHDQYGFTYYSTADLNAAFDPTVNSYFHKENILIRLDPSITEQTLRQYPQYNNYYVDEPYQRIGQNAFFVIVATLFSVYPHGSNLLFSDYYWPTIAYPPSGDGGTIWDDYLLNPSIYIMCDKYTDGNFNGDAHDYWNKYKVYYGIPYANISNWLSFASTFDQGDLLNVASAWGMNPIWVYGDDNFVNDSYFQTFANTAWITGWLLRQEKYLTIVYTCGGLDCNWQNQTGTWTVYSANYSDSTYVSY